MTIRTILKATEKFVTDNSPGILTGLAVAGTISTTLLASRAAYRVGMDASTQYHETVKESEALPEHLLDPKHLAKTYWREFIPAAVTSVGTITCIIAANHISTRRTAAIAAAFQLTEKLATEYKERVVETLGKQKEEKMRAELAADRIDRLGGAETVIITGPEAVFLDEFSGRFFKSEVEKVRKAVNDINFKVNTDFYASLTDFYELIGLDRTRFSDHVGWNADTQLDVVYTPTMMKDGRVAVAISFSTQPIDGFDRLQ